MNTYLIDTYRTDESFAYCHGHLWGICNTPLHVWSNSCREKDSINTYSTDMYRAGDLMDKRESNFWSVRVGAYCIRPSTYRAGDSIDKRESNFWSVRVGAYCIRPHTYRAGDTIDKRESNFWSVSVGAYEIRPSVYRVFDSMDKRE